MVSFRSSGVMFLISSNEMESKDPVRVGRFEGSGASELLAVGWRDRSGRAGEPPLDPVVSELFAGSNCGLCER